MSNQEQQKMSDVPQEPVTSKVVFCKDCGTNMTDSKACPNCGFTYQATCRHDYVFSSEITGGMECVLCGHKIGMG